jgi:hypothetical protein
MNNRSKNWFRLAWHPSDEELLAFLDGELEGKSAGKARKHLESCWVCRAKREQIERSISTFINYRHAALAKDAEASLQARMRLADKLSRLAAERVEQPQVLFRDGSLLRHFSCFRPAVLATVVAFFVIGLGIWFGWDRRVSASELLQRAAKTEVGESHQVNGLVAHRKFQVRRRSTAAAPEQVANWEVWIDNANRRFAQRVIHENGENGAQGVITRSSFSQATSATGKKRAQQSAPASEVMLELERIFQANRMDARRPVSATAYQNWRQSVRRRTEEVNETKLVDGAEALILITTVADAAPANGISEAALVVRVRDWRPVSQRLRVKAEGGEREYEITELAFQAVNPDAVDAAVFADQPVVALPSAIDPADASIPTSSPSALVASLPSAVASAELEIEVLERLNQVKALLGEQLNLTRASDGRLRVEGLVDTDARKSEILAALKAVAGNSAVNLEINTVTEAQARQAKSAPRRIIVQDAQVAQQAIPVETDLRNYFGAARGLSGQQLEQEIQRFSGQICNRSSLARSHALALKQIAERFTPAQLQALDQATRNRFNALLVEHARGYRRELERLRQQLQPIFPAASGTVATDGRITSDEGLIRAINRLFDLAATNDESLCRSFSVSTNPVTATAVKKQEFWRSIGAAEDLAAQIAGLK